MDPSLLATIAVAALTTFLIAFRLAERLAARRADQLPIDQSPRDGGETLPGE